MVYVIIFLRYDIPELWESCSCLTGYSVLFWCNSNTKSKALGQLLKPGLLTFSHLGCYQLFKRQLFLTLGGQYQTRLSVDISNYSQIDLLQHKFPIEHGLYSISIFIPDCAIKASKSKIGTMRITSINHSNIL